MDTKDHIIGHINLVGPIGFGEILEHLKEQDTAYPESGPTIYYVASIHTHLNDLIKAGIIEIYSTFDDSNDLAFVACEDDSARIDAEEQRIKAEGYDYLSDHYDSLRAAVVRLLDLELGHRSTPELWTSALEDVRDTIADYNGE
jgi:hypothetical protein